MYSSSASAHARVTTDAINLGSHFLRGPARIPVSKTRLKVRVRGLTAFDHIGSRANESSKARALHQMLGIDPHYGESHKLSQQFEASLISLCGLDGLGREFWLARSAMLAWQALKAAAMADNVVMVAISGFRSIEYQTALIRGKLRRGHTILQILQVTAAPGFSEHHTGRAIDIAEPSELAARTFLTEAFERTESYVWLTQNASRFGFTQSFGRDNHHGIAYEPWHWKFSTSV